MAQASSGLSPPRPRALRSWGLAWGQGFAFPIALSKRAVACYVLGTATYQDGVLELKHSQGLHLVLIIFNSKKKKNH